MIYVGIDPGRQGSLCLLDPSYEEPLFFSLNPESHNAFALVNHLQLEMSRGTVIAAIEEVHSLYGMSAKSNFTFGGMYWRARTILDAAEVIYERVTPKNWQAAVGIPPKKDRDPLVPLKRIVADLAQELYPKAPLFGPRGGLQDGRSDALMIAHYLKLQEEQ